MVNKFKKIRNFSLFSCLGNHNFPVNALKVIYQSHHVFGHQKLINAFFCKKCYTIMFLVISPKNNDLNGAKLSLNIFHFESTAIFSRIDQFTKLFHIFVVSLSVMHLKKTTHVTLKSKK